MSREKSNEPGSKDGGSAAASQRERFERAAREAGVELDEAQLKRALRQMKERGKGNGNDG